jgi:hypothetical protein
VNLSLTRGMPEVFCRGPSVAVHHTSHGSEPAGMRGDLEVAMRGSLARPFVDFRQPSHARLAGHRRRKLRKLHALRKLRLLRRRGPRNVGVSMVRMRSHCAQSKSPGGHRVTLRVVGHALATFPAGCTAARRACTSGDRGAAGRQPLRPTSSNPNRCGSTCTRCQQSLRCGWRRSDVHRRVPMRRGRGAGVEPARQDLEGSVAAARPAACRLVPDEGFGDPAEICSLSP